MYFLSSKPLANLVYIKTLCCIALTFATTALSAQTESISGEISIAGGSPPGQVRVFLANTTLTTQSDEKGLYILKNIPHGSYVLSTFAPGYEPNQQPIMVVPGVKNADISLKQSSAAPKSAETERKKIEQFLKTLNKGRRDIELLNPGTLRVTTKGTVLEASSDGVLNLQNDYLGYETKLWLKKYVKELSRDEDKLESGPEEYEGIISYTELNGSSTDQKRWQTNRLKSYQGSAVHFYRSLIANDLSKQGFTIYPFVSKLNSKRSSDSLINNKILLFENPSAGEKRNDSLKFWKAQRELPKYNHVIYHDSIKTSELISIDPAGVYVLKYPYKLYVKYTHPDAETTAMTNNAMLNFHKPVNELFVVIELKDHLLRIDGNGNVLEPAKVSYEGGWSPKLAEMLPLDYYPEKLQ